ncbi:hypothetical protein L1987_87861 [Smallanthus sonchifolius]|nr:hypothetical protein L1987_87861 [Smallanthus sonchifolius]
MMQESVFKGIEDLSYNNLTGNVPKFLAQLDYLRNLNLSGNNFTRPLPAEFLAKSKKGSLSLSIEDIGSCLKASSTSNKHTIVILAITIITLFIVGLFASVIIVWEVKRRKAKALIKRETSFTPRKQQFTYSEVVSITSNFQNEIGRVGFGRVFHGLVEENQVAVKMLSESKVKLLMEIHHTNITSLVGYSDESNHKAIIYDFVAYGNLEKYLFGNWL